MPDISLNSEALAPVTGAWARGLGSASDSLGG